jgi:hypothetical protein
LEHDPGRHTREACRQMVEQRHLVVKSLATGPGREQLEGHLDMIVKIQNTIDITDRMTHERDGAARSEANGRPGQRIVGSSGPAGAASP